MSQFQRIKDFFRGVVTLALAIVLFLTPKEGYFIIAIVVSFSLFFYGFRLLWFYFTMSRHMVGGKSSLYMAVIVLDFALFTSSVASMNSMIILFYLLGIYAFSGFVDIMRAFESKKIGAPNWRLRLVTGIVSFALAVVWVVFGLFQGRTDLLVYGYCVSLCYSAIARIITSLRKTEVAFFQ